VEGSGVNKFGGQGGYVDEDMTEGLVQGYPEQRMVPRMQNRNVPDLAKITDVVTSGSNNPPQRKYLPTLSDLVDRLSIVQLKAVFITEHTEEYVKERALIEHDVDLILNELAKNGNFIKASHVHAIIVLAIANRFIWENESKARAGGSEHDHLLKLTHSINGVRNTAKNQLAAVDGGRRDYKVDCLSADLPLEFGNWRIFD
jgi:hypothetical protein